MPDFFLIQLAIIFLPGVVWARLDAQYSSKTKPTDIEFFLRAFMFGLASYAATFLVYLVCGWQFEMIDLSQAEAKAVINGNVAWQVAIAMAVGFVLAVLWMYASNYKWLTRLLQTIGATKTFGDEDVWDFTFNSQNAAVEYVHVRVFEDEITYAGWVVAFSETGKLRELVLRDVQVYNFGGECLFETPRVYLARAPERIHIEFPYKQEGS